MKYWHFLFIFLIVFLFVPILFHSQAAIVLNEIAVQPTQTVELINTASESANISNWYIDDSGGTTYFTIPDSTTLPPGSCLVFTGDFNFNKSTTDIARLFDAAAPPTSTSAHLVDSYTYAKGPDAGMSFSRIPDGSGDWTTQTSTFGMLNQSGMPCVPTATPTLIPTSSPTPTTAPSPTQTTVTPTPTSPTPADYDSVYISEVYPYPNTGESEWVELFNNSDTEAVLTNWKMDDVENGGSSPRSFSLTIPAKGYRVVSFSSSLFNNDGDSVRLLNFSGSLKDSMEYIDAKQGLSFGRKDNSVDEYCLQAPSPNASNNVCSEEPTSKPEKNTSVLSTTSKVSPSKKQITVTSQKAGITKIKQTTLKLSPAKGSILGVTTIQPKNSSSHIYISSYLYFISASYALLTVASCAIRMKYATYP